MFKKTIINLSKSQPDVVKDFLALPLSKNIKNAYVSNESLLDELKLPYDLRGEYTPRRLINPYKRKPMNVIYDQSTFQQFVMPSKRKVTHGFIDIEKLFGIKRWRNDSPFIKEYIKIDDQIFFLTIIATIIVMLVAGEKHRRIDRARREILLNDKAVFSYEDLI